MKDLIIIGAGGMGRQVYQFAKMCKGYGSEFIIKGFLDRNLKALDGYRGYPPVLGSDDTYQIEGNDVFFNSIGDVHAKKKVITLIRSKGGHFISLIHPSAIITDGVKIGEGCMVASKVGIGGCTEIGDFCLIQDNAIIGHDVKIGDFCRVDCNVVLIAGVSLGECACVHTSSVVNHNVRVGENATVGALSFVIRNVKPGTTVQGNPAKNVIL